MAQDVGMVWKCCESVVMSFLFCLVGFKVPIPICTHFHSESLCLFFFLRMIREKKGGERIEFCCSERTVIVNSNAFKWSPTIKLLYRSRNCCPCKLYLLSCVESSQILFSFSSPSNTYLIILLLKACTHPLYALHYTLYHLILTVAVFMYVSGCPLISHCKLSQQVLSWASVDVLAINI